MIQCNSFFYLIYLWKKKRKKNFFCKFFFFLTNIANCICFTFVFWIKTVITRFPWYFSKIFAWKGSFEDTPFTFTPVSCTRFEVKNGNIFVQLLTSFNVTQYTCTFVISSVNRFRDNLQLFLRHYLWLRNIWTSLQTESVGLHGRISRRLAHCFPRSNYFDELT